MVPAPAAPGRWRLPGGLVDHGEHPEHALQRYALAQAGVRIDVGPVHSVVTAIDEAGHTDWIVLEASTPDEAIRDASWVADAALTPGAVSPLAARALGLGPDAPAPVAAPESVPVEPGVVRRRQRFAAYALVTDPGGRVLLTRIREGYPGAGSWHLPGGGTDPGEAAPAGVLRELIEETDQRGRIVGPLFVSHRYQRDALGPEGVPIDWHGVRVVYRAIVDQPTPARVTEAGGSTSDAAWMEVDDALGRSLTEVARDSITRYLKV